MFKNFLYYILCLAPWFLSSIIPVDYDYYDTINLPFFAPGNWFYMIVWPTVYILLAFNLYFLFKEISFKDTPLSYKISLFINYIFNQEYTLVAFGLKNNFLGFVFCLGNLISLLFLYEETYQLKISKIKLLWPYIAISIFAVILSFSIYIMNL